MTEHTTTEGRTEADVTALAKVLSGATPEFAERAAENHMTQARRLLASDWLADRLAAVQAEAKCEGLAPFCCNNPSCPVHGDTIDPAELDAARLVSDMAEAEVVTLRTRAESAEAERDAARAEVEALRERVGKIARNPYAHDVADMLRAALDADR